MILKLCFSVIVSVICGELALAVSLSGVSLITHINTAVTLCLHSSIECVCQTTADHQHTHQCVISNVSRVFISALTFSSAQSFSSAMFIRRQNTEAARGKAQRSARTYNNYS